MEKNKLMIIFVGVLIITSVLFFYTGRRVGYEEGYDSGYFHGWHESQFIDCTLPELNQTMGVVHYDKSVEGMIREDYFEWEDLCSKLNLKKLSAK